MTETHQLSIQLRQRAGKGAARSVRRDGRVPGVIYGGKQEPLLISIDPLELTARAAQARLLRHALRPQARRRGRIACCRATCSSIR